MAQNVEWSAAARSDLEQIADYIAHDSQFYAAAFVRHVRDSARKLGSIPEAGAIVPELQRPDIREIFVKRYRLVYRVTAKAVYILAVIHGARDFRSAWSSEELTDTDDVED